MEFGAHDKIVNVFHFDGDVSRTHGVPFKFVVKPVSLEASFGTAETPANFFHPCKAERLSEMKKRLQYRLGVSGEDFSRFRFALVQTAASCRVCYLTDGRYALLDLKF